MSIENHGRSPAGAERSEPAGVLERRVYRAEPVSHSHPYHQLVLPLSGALELNVAEQGGHVGGLRAALITAGEDHVFRGRTDNRCLVLDWPAGSADEALWESARRRPFVDLDPGLLYYARFLDAELARGAGAALTRQAGSLLVLALAERLEQLPDYPRRLRAALAYMDRHYAARPGVADIGRAVGLSARQLHALCREWLGRTPQDYLTEQRLDRALVLLVDESIAIADIAQRVGFADQSALTRCLRRHHGVTPAAWRRNRRAPGQERRGR